MESLENYLVDEWIGRLGDLMTAISRDGRQAASEAQSRQISPQVGDDWETLGAVCSFYSSRCHVVLLSGCVRLSRAL